jgi:glucan 1,4-alpha-glucosidase
MKNMKIGTAIWVCLLLSFFFDTSAKAESITSPDGQLKLNFSVNMQGEPVYELSYKGKEVIKPSDSFAAGTHSGTPSHHYKDENK